MTLSLTSIATSAHCGVSANNSFERPRVRDSHSTVRYIVPVSLALESSSFALLSPSSRARLRDLAFDCQAGIASSF